MTTLQRGNCVAAKSPSRPLRCGSSEYPYAFVVQAEPLVLVSQSADMRWGSFKAEDLEVIGEGNMQQMIICDSRLEK